MTYADIKVGQSFISSLLSSVSFCAYTSDFSSCTLFLSEKLLVSTVMQSVFQSTLQTPDRRMSLDPVYSIILCSQLESAKPACGELPWISRLSSTSTLSVPSSLSSTSSTPFQPPPPASLLNESKPNYDSAHNHENISTNHCVQHVTENLQYSKLISTRKHFVSRITKSSSRRGFLICSLCNLEIWGPNGKLLYLFFSESAISSPLYMQSVYWRRLHFLSTNGRSLSHRKVCRRL